MNNCQITVKNFLNKYSMDYERVDIEQGCQNFINEMINGLEGRKSTLMMIPTYISMGEDIPHDEPIIVMDAGGTNFRVAVAYFDRDKKPVIEDYKLYPMPGSQGEISKDEFFSTIASYMEPVVNRSDRVGFCFSYATETLPNKDGRAIAFSKEVRIRDMVGEVIGENLLKYLKARGCSADKKIVLINDTVATLLGGKASYPDRVFDSYIGFILGTGTNTCYMENISNIKKINNAGINGGSMLINMESAGFGKISRGVIDIEFDNRTVDPGEAPFEKMISGRYQGELLLAVVKKAAQEGLFSKYFVDRIAAVNKLTTKEMNNYLYYPYQGSLLSECCLEGSDDHMILYYLIDSIVERAAKLVTINLASIMMKTGTGKNPCKPVCINADGSTFYKSKLFRSKLEYYVKKYINDEKGLYLEFVNAENATLVGTAIAGLMN